MEENGPLFDSDRRKDCIEDYGKAIEKGLVIRMIKGIEEQQIKETLVEASELQENKLLLEVRPESIGANG